MKISKIFADNKDSIILLDLVIPSDNNQSKISVRGTGFIISKNGEFVTCAHIWKQIPENEREYLGVKVPTETDTKGITHYKRYNVKLLKIDEENDIALMQIISGGKNNFKAVKGFGDTDLVNEGDEVVFLGYPLALDLLRLQFGITMSMNQCIISSVKRRNADGSLHFFMVDTHINDGSSGSPLFETTTGKIIGIAAGKISSRIPAPNGGQLDIPANMGICRPSKYIVNLVNK